MPPGPAATPPGRTKVMYIAGTGRSGSTLVVQILDRVPGAVGVGEVRYLWDRGILQNRLCGCGKPFSDCPVWTTILDEAFGGAGGVDAKAAMADQQARTRLRRVPGLLWASRRRSPGGDSAHAGRLGRLYPAIAAATASAVVVDSSKLPTYGWLLGQVPEIDLYVVHLVRDPRAAAYSWTRRKPLPDVGADAVMATQGLVRSSVLWTVWNLTAERFWAHHTERYLRIRYEDLVAAPRHAIDQMLALVGLDGPEGAAGSVFLDDQTTELGVTHSVAGNPDRLKQGPVSIRADNRWQACMSGFRQAVVTALALPRLARYHYPLRPAHAGSAPDGKG
ncbi:MAG: sulfotransferase [Acidimicrobiales bacterium]